MPTTPKDDNASAIQEANQMTAAIKDDILSRGDVTPSSTMCQASPTPPPPPPSAKDRGYAWIVLGAVFWINTLCAGFIKSFGITVLLLLDYFPNAPVVYGGWIMGMLIGTRCTLAPLMGALAVRAGPRRCVVFGSLVIVLGLFFAIPLFSIYYMAFTLGGLIGIGICMTETPGYLLISEYFVEKRSLANAIQAIGNPLGGILFSPLVVFLNEEFGLQGSFIILAGIMLHMAILGMLMRPFELQEQILHHQQLKKILPKQHNIENGNENTLTQAGKHQSKKTLNFKLFKDPQYILYLVGTVSVSLPMPNCVLYMPAYGQSVGLTNYQVSIIVSYLSGCDCAWRFLSGCIIQKFHLNPAHVLIVGLTLGGVGCLLVTLCSNMWQLMLTATLVSCGLAVFWALINTLLANEFGVESLASSWGFVRMVQGISNFVCPPIIGLMKDLTGGLVVPYVIMGAGYILGVFIFSLKLMTAKISKTRNKQ